MEILILPILITFFASVIGTITGFGISTIMIPAMLVSHPLSQVVLFVAIIHLANDIWKLVLFYGGIRWQILLYFGVAGFFATIIGALLSIRVGMNPYFLQLFGLFLIAYSLVVLLRPVSFFKQTTFSLIQGGALSGFFYGLFGMGGLLRSAALIVFNMDKAVYLATNGALALIVDVTRVVVYTLSGLTLGEGLITGLVFCVPMSFVGAKVGEKIVHFIPQEKFRLLVVGFILLMGLKLVLKI